MKLDTTILVRLTKKDKELINKYCEEHDLIIARFMRRAILDTIRNNMKEEE